MAVYEPVMEQCSECCEWVDMADMDEDFVCDDCQPRCLRRGCREPMMRGGEGCCVRHEAEAAAENQASECGGLHA